jgi:hypothetical protein
MGETDVRGRILGKDYSSIRNMFKADKISMK